MEDWSGGKDEKIRQDMENMSRLPMNDVLLFSPKDKELKKFVYEKVSNAGIGIHPVYHWRDGLKEGLPEGEPGGMRCSRAEEFKSRFGNDYPSRAICPSWLGIADTSNALRVLDEFCTEWKPYLAGVHLDGIRYFNMWKLEDFPCECSACQHQRKPWLGHGVLSEEDRHNPAVMYKELEMRNMIITGYVGKMRAVTEKYGLAFSLAARAVYIHRDHDYSYEPGPQGHGAALYEGQDWVKWCKEGLLDFVCPMNYATTDIHERRIEEHIRLLGDKKDILYEAVHVKSSSGDATPDQVAEQVKQIKEHDLNGFTIFSWKPVTEAFVKAFEKAIRE